MIQSGKSADFKIIPTLAIYSIQLQIPAAAAGVLTANLYNATGKQIITFNNAGNNQRLYVGHLPAGSYYVQIQTAQGVQTARFIKL